ncbi:MAG: hypothetical protein RLZZ165_1515 [Bacteroidota bacterium]
MGVEKPVLGHGPGRYPGAFPFYRRGRGEADRISHLVRMAAWGHSDTLTTLAESGFPAVLAFLGMLAMTGRTAFRRLPGNGTGMTMQGAMALGWVGWVLHGCFNDLLGNAA